MSRGRVIATDGTAADKADVHLPGLMMLDTTTLCGFTWRVRAVEPTRRLTCELCRKVLAEMREAVREHRGIRGPS